nr:hypothetical protein [uncultured Butyrivibrio sp.]
MKLRINCQTCDARKINEENYKEFSQIKVYTEELLVDDRSKEVLNRLPFNIKAEEVRSKDLSEESGKTININGIYEISPQSNVAEGTSITVNGVLKVAPGSQEKLKIFSRITVNGLILCPKSIAALLPFPGLTINGMTKAYPDDYTLMDNRYKLDKYFAMRAPENSGYFAANFIYDSEMSVDFAKMAEKNIKFSTDKAYIRKSHIETAIPLFNIEAEIAEMPDDCSVVVADQSEIDSSFIDANGESLYIIGNAHISAENKDVIGKIKSLIVEGNLTVDADCEQLLKEIYVKCDKLIISRGRTIEDVAIATIDRRTLEEAPGGITVRDCALLKIDKDVPAELITQKLKVRDCAKITCSSEQKAAVSAVSRDVAFIGSDNIKSLFGNLFGNRSDEGYEEETPSAFEDDTKYINAEYYEL